MDEATFRSLLNHALRSEGPERDNALGRISAIMEKTNTSLTDIRVVKSGALANILTLRNDLTAERQITAQLRNEVARLKAVIVQAGVSDAEEPIPDDPITRVIRIHGAPKNGLWPFDALKQVMTYRRNKEHGWQSVFATAMQANGNPQAISSERIQQWRVKGTVPEAVVRAAAVVALPVVAGKGNVRWTQEEWDALKEYCGPAPDYLIKDGNTYASIGRDLTKRFSGSRHFTENAIKGAICNGLRKGLTRRGQAITAPSENAKSVA